MDQQGIGVADVDCISPAVGKRDTREDSAVTPVRPQWRFALLGQQYHAKARRQGSSTFAHRPDPACTPAHTSSRSMEGTDL